MHGGDADRLTRTGQRFVQSSHELRRHGAQLGSMMVSAGWIGADADRSRADWQAVGAPALRRTSAFVEYLGRQLIGHAAEQRRASAAIGVRSVSAGARSLTGDLTGDLTAGLTAGLVDELVGGAGDVLDDVLDDVVTRTGDLVDDVMDDVVDRVRDVFDGAVGGHGDHGRASPDVSEATRLRPSTFPAPSGGRDAVLAAMTGLADGERIGRDEIEIRALDNGRYIVVLPGVTDLSDGFDRFVDRVRDHGPLVMPGAGREAVESWADNDEPTVRKMRYAYEAARHDDTTVNEYSVVTVGALQAAGVPVGADVMLIGHSFGAYTAIDLAADPSFNAAHGEHPTGYHVEITHVIAAGAETDWRFDELPAATDTLVLNNRFDGVYRAEDLLHRDGEARYPGHVEQNFWGGWQGYGHDESNYIDWLDDTGSDRIEAWLGGVGDRYAVGGIRVSVQVLDPNL